MNMGNYLKYWGLTSSSLNPHLAQNALRWATLGTPICHGLHTVLELGSLTVFRAPGVQHRFLLRLDIGDKSWTPSQKHLYGRNIAFRVLLSGPGALLSGPGATKNTPASALLRQSSACRSSLLSDFVSNCV